MVFVYKYAHSLVNNCNRFLRPFHQKSRHMWIHTSGVSHTRHLNLDELYNKLIAGNRSALAQGITLIESTNENKKTQSQAFLSKVLDHMKINNDPQTATSFRIGLSGPPGAGKSTFIEGFGTYLTEIGHTVAVLTVDPSSSTTGGSLLGDKTRMPKLSCNPSAYIRPSPASGTLGGVTRTTNEAITLCEGAGYNVILVETVGVGQSEFVVADMVDMFCLIIPPAGGDELQGIKRGIVEVADVVVVNKSDGDLVAAARRIQREYISALKYATRRSSPWKPKVMRISSVTQEGVPELWETMCAYQLKMTDGGALFRKRESQRVVWMWNHVRDHIMTHFSRSPRVRERLTHIEEQVAAGLVSPGSAADELLDLFTGHSKR